MYSIWKQCLLLLSLLTCQLTYLPIYFQLNLRLTVLKWLRALGGCNVTVKDGTNGVLRFKTSGRETFRHWIISAPNTWHEIPNCNNVREKKALWQIVEESSACNYGASVWLTFHLNVSLREVKGRVLLAVTAQWHEPNQALPRSTWTGVSPFMSSPVVGICSFKKN